MRLFLDRKSWVIKDEEGRLVEIATAHEAVTEGTATAGNRAFIWLVTCRFDLGMVKEIYKGW